MLSEAKGLSTTIGTFHLVNQISYDPYLYAISNAVLSRITMGISQNVDITLVLLKNVSKYMAKRLKIRKQLISGQYKMYPLSVVFEGLL